MRDVAFGLAITGVFLLFGMMIFMPVNYFDSFSEIRVNEKVILSGKVTDERIIGDLSIMKINGIEVVCKKCIYVKGKNVSVIGKVEEYNGKKQIRALSLETN